MTRKKAKSVDQTSLGTPGTTETPGALHSPPVAYREPRSLLPSTPFQSSSATVYAVPEFIWGMSAKADSTYSGSYSAASDGIRSGRIGRGRLRSNA
jgi:hypothetical protein